MKISQIAAALGLDETDGVRVVPLTDADIAAASQDAPTPPAPNRAQRRASGRRQPRKKRSLNTARR